MPPALVRSRSGAHEACTQLWERGGDRQVAGQPKVALVSNGAYGLGCLLLRRD